MRQLVPALYASNSNLLVCEAVDPESLDGGDDARGGSEERDLIGLSTTFGGPAFRISTPAFASNASAPTSRIVSWMPASWKIESSVPAGHPAIAGYIAVVHRQHVGVYSLSLAASFAFEASTGDAGMDDVPDLPCIAQVRWASALQPTPGLSLPSFMKPESFVAS